MIAKGNGKNRFDINKKNLFNLMLRSFAVGIAMSSLCIVLLTFLMVYWKGLETGAYRWSVDINYFGEAHIEFVVFIIGIPLALYFVFKWFTSDKIIRRYLEQHDEEA